ncbi:MAG: hypothetical protein FWG92_06150 [Leptospirales bacterium]|nr:hypothetical protein [Leptospirales bacterium]
MKFFFFIILATLLLCCPSVFVERPVDYEIVYQKQAGKTKEERIKNVQIYPSEIIMSNDGAVFVLDKHEDYYRLSKIPLGHGNPKELVLEKSSMELDERRSTELFPCRDGGLLLKYYRQDTYDSKYSLIVIHISKDMKIKNKFKSYVFGYALPALKKGQNFYYSLSYNDEENPRIVYIIDKNGNYLKLLDINTKTTEASIGMVFNYYISTAYNDKYMAISNYGLYLFDPENEYFDKMADLTKEINAVYKKLNGRKPKKSVSTFAVHYDSKTGFVVFAMNEYAGFMPRAKLLSRYIAAYNPTTKELKMMKLDDKFDDMIYLLGAWDGIVYVSNWETGMAYGLKF